MDIGAGERERENVQGKARGMERCAKVRCVLRTNNRVYNGGESSEERERDRICVQETKKLILSTGRSYVLPSFFIYPARKCSSFLFFFVSLRRHTSNMYFSAVFLMQMISSVAHAYGFCRATKKEEQ